MPELPEVETIAQKLQKTLRHHSIDDVDILWAGTIDTINPDTFKDIIKGMTVHNVWRRGKYLVIELDENKKLIIHLRMSGRFSIRSSCNRETYHKHTRVRFFLDNQKVLDYIDQRKFGRFYLVDDILAVTGHLGPEPLSDFFTEKWFSSAIMQRNGQVKTLLLNQHFIAGLGNIYANEILWTARIHPARKANSLNHDEIRRLYFAIINVLEQAIHHGGTSLDDRQYTYPDGQLGNHQQHLFVYDRASEYCERCGFPIERFIQSQRSSYFCPNCQPTQSVSSDNSPER
jgi:formamidopyrimidine-DNA glycosylase